MTPYAMPASRLGVAIKAGITSLREDVSVATKTPNEEPGESLIDELDLQSDEWPTALFPGEPKKDQALLVRTIGERLRQARELCNLSQSAAAKRLGYANPSKLSKIETATDTNSVPLWLIPRAAMLYEVSVDFLFGVSSEWEVGVPRGTQAWLLDAWERMRERDLTALDCLHREVASVAKFTTKLAEEGRAASDALNVFRAMNSHFDQTRGGADLLLRLDRIRRQSDAALSAFGKLKLAPPRTGT